MSQVRFDPHSTQPTVKKFGNPTQPNPSTPKNRPNPSNWVELSKFWWIGGLASMREKWGVHSCTHLLNSNSNRNVYPKQ